MPTVPEGTRRGRWPQAYYDSSCGAGEERIRVQHPDGGELTPDPMGETLDSLSDYLRAERWLLALASDPGWDVRTREGSHKDDLFVQIAQALKDADGTYVYESPELGHAGLRLQTSGVDSVLAVVASDDVGSIVTFFENPNREIAGELADSRLEEVLVRMMSSARSSYASVDAMTEIRRIRGWLPELARVAQGEVEEATVLEQLGRAGAGTVLVALRPDRGHVDAAWAASSKDGWATGETHLRNAAALKLETFGSAEAATVAKLLGIPSSGPWSFGRAASGTLVAVAGGPESPETLDLVAELFSAAFLEGRDTTAARNNALLTERARIAGVIHEGITQVLTNVAIQMEVLDQVMEDPGAARKMVANMRKAVLEALDSLRGAILELTPNAPEWTDLARGLERFVGDFGSQWGLTLTYAVEGTPRDVDPDALALVFGVVQEALSNVRKHSGVEEADVKLVFLEDEISVSVTDHGKGFDPTDRVEEGFRQHQGLQIVRARVRLAGGRISIDSEPGKGSTMTLEVMV